MFGDDNWCCDGFLVIVRFQPHKMMSKTQHKAKLCTLCMESCELQCALCRITKQGSLPPRRSFNALDITYIDRISFSGRKSIQPCFFFTRNLSSSSLHPSWEPLRSCNTCTRNSRGYTPIARMLIKVAAGFVLGFRSETVLVSDYNDKVLVQGISNGCECAI